MKTIKLQNSLKTFIVDDSDEPGVNSCNWFLNKSSINTTFGDKTISIGQFILSCSPLEADHKDRNIFNNRRENLRSATECQNKMNSVFVPNSSGYRGVSWNKPAKKWQVQISANKKAYYLGCFDDLKLAAQKYNEAAIKYHGEFAVLNDLT